MKKYIFLTVLLVIGVVTVAGCKEVDQISPLNSIEQYNTAVENNMTKISYYIPADGADDKTNYCNGAEMDSAGYKATLTKQVNATVAGKLEGDALINRTLNLAAQAAGFTPNPAETEDYVSVKDGVATIAPIDAWAGVSIYLCAWKPFVEKNLEQFGEIKKVDWENF